VAEEGADAVGHFRRENVLELAGLLRDDFGVFDMQCVGEQAFGETVAADDVLRAPAATLRERDDCVAVFRQRGDYHGSVVASFDVAVRVVGVMRVQFDEAELRHALHQQSRRQWTRSADAADVGRLAILFVEPELLKHFVELVIVAKLGAATGGEALFRGDVSVLQLD
jgi:hypothetical protein